ncbi:hypothetical protein Avbf_11714 [Armadillidium vulgare]|nr:hypothetical protein Avbf_11714 [Armadillidium vulgare]
MKRRDERESEEIAQCAGLFDKGRDRKKIINQKKKIKTLQNEIEVLKSKNASIEIDNDTLKKKLNRDGSNAGIEKKAFKDRLKKQQYHDATIALELKLVNRYIAEKINDNMNFPREEEKDLSENEPISYDMID